jgi:putative peptidoglycan lipid II flippase
MSATAAASPGRISEWKVVKGGLVVAVGMMTGQALGFVRHAFIAWLLGTGPRADAISVAFVPVDLLWAVLSTAVVFGFGPMLAARTQHRVGPCFGELAGLLFRPVLVFTTALILLAGPVVKILAPGLSRETAETAALLLRMTSLAIPALAGSALFTALLYSERRFTVPALHQSVVNITTIAVAALFAVRYGPFAFAAGFVAGAWLQLGAVWWNARDVLRRQRESKDRLGWWFVLREPLPVLLYSVLVGLNAVVTRAFASTFGVGATSGFEYSLRLLGVPLALLVVPLSSSMLSEIARFRSLHDPGAALRAIRKAALVTVGLAAALTAVVVGFAPWIVSLLFERGSFGPLSTATVSEILRGFFPSLIAWSVLDILSRSLFSLGRTRVPILAAGAGLLVNATVCAEAPIRFIGGIGFGSIAGFLAGALIVAVHLWRIGGAGAGAEAGADTAA